MKAPIEAVLEECLSSEKNHWSESAEYEPDIYLDGGGQGDTCEESIQDCNQGEDRVCQSL